MSDAPWAKAARVRAGLQRLLAPHLGGGGGGDADAERELAELDGPLLDVMLDAARTRDHGQASGCHADVEEVFSSPFVLDPYGCYGTRTSALVTHVER